MKVQDGEKVSRAKLWDKILLAREAYQSFNDEEWKALKEYEKVGYVFETHPFYGTRWNVAESVDQLRREECEAWQRLVGLEWPWEVYVYDTVTSTNDEALRASEAVEWGIFAANHQTKGRGRRDRRWDSSSSGGLYFSLVVDKKNFGLPASLITTGIGVAVYDALSKWMPPFMTLKWPNDLIVYHRKLAGILVERQMGSGSHFSEDGKVVIGIGVNIHQKEEEWDETLKGRAISLRMVRGRSDDLRKAEVLMQIVKACERVFKMDAGEVRAAWHRRCTDLERIVMVVQEDGRYQGRFLGLTEDGALLLVDDQGVTRQFWAGDCSLVQ
ncbi:MAG: biotin--[acetyl-CoA-carboxylase] ligase [Methylacidiphilales bacterium]|nr:biotin--[acetyl-CoA-carboxylase] ligase [Candidatus Methylacidiphilales bacterium]MDW8348654.1 biotin--[acetyl-CoA-carboxylase] ligase [Verrucomicrobiae bacterium]